MLHEEQEGHDQLQPDSISPEHCIAAGKKNVSASVVEIIVSDWGVYTLKSQLLSLPQLSFQCPPGLTAGSSVTE